MDSPASVLTTNRARHASCWRLIPKAKQCSPFKMRRARQSSPSNGTTRGWGKRVSTTATPHTTPARALATPSHHHQHHDDALAVHAGTAHTPATGASERHPDGRPAWDRAQPPALPGPYRPLGCHWPLAIARRATFFNISLSPSLRPPPRCRESCRWRRVRFRPTSWRLS
jgi:hypothetical protein